MSVRIRHSGDIFPEWAGDVVGVDHDRRGVGGNNSVASVGAAPAEAQHQSKNIQRSSSWSRFAGLMIKKKYTYRYTNKQRNVE